MMNENMERERNNRVAYLLMGWCYRSVIDRLVVVALTKAPLCRYGEH